MTHLRLRIGALAIVLASAGCGLISSDVTNLNLDLPEKRFIIDTAGWNIDQQMASTALNAACSSSSQCMTAAENVCAMDCSGTCNAAMRCAINLDVGLHAGVNLVMEKPELQQLNDRPVIEVTIDAVTYEVQTNTLNVETPEIGVYVAPMSVMDPTDPEAKRIGTIAPVAAGMVTTSPQDLKFTGDGKQHLVTVMNNFKTPFNVIVGSTLTMTAGQPIPSGRLDSVVHIKAHVGI